MQRSKFLETKATIIQLVEEYNAAVAEASKFSYLVRDTKIQQEQINNLTKLKTRIKGFKYGAIEAGCETSANTLFHLQCGLNAQISFLNMWILLKKDDYYSAWDSLIDAEEYISIAMRASDQGFGLIELLDHLRCAENVIFPGYRIYNSWGAIIKGGLCTVCSEPLSICKHIEGKVYWGRLCVRVRPDIVTLDHVALVEEPKDRRCVITELTSDDGWFRDYMTWRKTRRTKTTNGKTSRKFAGRVYNNKLLEVD